MLIYIKDPKCEPFSSEEKEAAVAQHGLKHCCTGERRPCFIGNIRNSAICINANSIPIAFGVYTENKYPFDGKEILRLYWNCSD
ncbi:hypothetical protein WUBG_03046 [Wuchereria bancrofti]|uniref:Uncharacterized protein n=1 Tax=Wuchereria bancrofti TaxID=6293 RepID=J9FFE7_WUCBA|nr:hypothetical protein WUBG_03046 [Wuchereria bancrofti]